MPSYEYKCPTCPMTITIVRGIREEEHKPVCIGCGAVMVRVFANPNLEFKGTGWGKDA